MAVLQGARLRDAAIPADRPRVRGRARAEAPATSWAPRGVRPAGLVIAGILAATMVGLVYLTQTLGSNATSAELDDLASDANRLRGFLRNQDVAVEVFMEPGDIAKQAKKLGLKQLDDAIVLRLP